MAWCGHTGRFHFIKETSGAESTIRGKISATRGTPLGFYEASGSALLLSLRAGGDGYCGVAANFYPDLFVWLCKNFGAYPEESDELQFFLSLADRAISVGYPKSSKVYLNRGGLAIETGSRVTDHSFGERDLRTLEHLDRAVSSWRGRLALIAEIQVGA